jgi:ribonucleoside-diphosphate reductase beta chain
VDTVVKATQVEEQIHAMFGGWLVGLIRAERPEWFGRKFYDTLAAACRKAVEAETVIVDWIYADGELPYLTRPMLDAFVKDRVNQGVLMIGGDPVFHVRQADLDDTRWFYEGLRAPVEVDFFHKRSTNYSSHTVSCTADDLF